MEETRARHRRKALGRQGKKPRIRREARLSRMRRRRSMSGEVRRCACLCDSKPNIALDGFDTTSCKVHATSADDGAGRDRSQAFLCSEARPGPRTTTTSARRAAAASTCSPRRSGERDEGIKDKTSEARAPARVHHATRHKPKRLSQQRTSLAVTSAPSDDTAQLPPHTHTHYLHQQSSQEANRRRRPRSQSQAPLGNIAACRAAHRITAAWPSPPTCGPVRRPRHRMHPPRQRAFLLLTFTRFVPVSAAWRPTHAPCRRRKPQDFLVASLGRQGPSMPLSLSSARPPSHPARRGEGGPRRAGGLRTRKSPMKPGVRRRTGVRRAGLRACACIATASAHCAASRARAIAAAPSSRAWRGKRRSRRSPLRCTRKVCLGSGGRARAHGAGRRRRRRGARRKRAAHDGERWRRPWVSPAG